MVKDLIEQGAGEKEGGVSYAEVEMDSPDIGDLAHRYTVCIYTQPSISHGRRLIILLPDYIDTDIDGLFPPRSPDGHTSCCCE